MSVKAKGRSAMAKEAIRTKEFSYGGAAVAGFSPDPAKSGMRSLNVRLSFEEALKLHFALGQGLAAIGKLNRSTREGKAAALALSICPAKDRIVVNKSKLAQ